MIDISKYIYDYLLAGNVSVVVPDLGCFSIVDKPSVIQNNIVIPPVKTIEFDAENSEDDHFFTRYVAEKENITVEQAIQEIYKFYEHYFIQKLPNSKQSIVFENFGEFSLNYSGDMQFMPVADLFKDHYGLDQVSISGHAAAPPPIEAAPVIPEPAAPQAPEPIVPPVQPSSELKEQEPKQEEAPPASGESLFGSGSSTRYRENTERRRPAVDVPPTQPAPAQPAQPTKSSNTSNTSKPSKPMKPSTPPKQPKQPQAKKTCSSNLWVLWVLLIAAGLGVAGYYFYPNINKYLTKGKSQVIIAEPQAEPENTAVAEENTPNSEVSQSLDEATDRKNALNPATHQQTPSSSSSSSSTTAARSVTPTQGSAGRGQWVMIAGSFKVQSNAEKFMRTLQAEGLNPEIIATKNQLYWVAVASFDNLSEAQRQAREMNSKREVWIARR